MNPKKQQPRTHTDEKPLLTRKTRRKHFSDDHQIEQSVEQLQQQKKHTQPF